MLFLKKDGIETMRTKQDVIDLQIGNNPNVPQQENA